ncbi:hypothetical protein HMPREF0742_02104 [Rothia aeria F0184]|uniref:Uncharacterized protein n=1 Tax=Rothia aeria F0184 TaxID=888019 RepID=U7V279_9MICC|nr:hypothetical protein HMPREF0742_02104 [Rothia aeria F0184]
MRNAPWILILSHGISDLLLTFDFSVNVALNLCQSFIPFSGQHVITKEYWFI